MTVFGDRAFAEVMKVKRGRTGGILAQAGLVFYKEETSGAHEYAHGEKAL